MSMLRYLLGALLCACAAPASATVLVDFQMSGPVTGSFSAYLSGSPKTTVPVSDLESCTVSAGYVCGGIILAPDLFGDGIEDFLGFRFITPDESSGGFPGFAFDLGSLLTPGTYVPFGSSIGFSGILTVTDAPGVIGIGYVPEPSTWAMMLLGFAAIGAAVRRKSQLQAA